MGIDQEEDRKRFTIELNMRAARKRQSAQTGFIHHCYEIEDFPDSRHDTIPLYENFCFVVALLRTKTSDNMLEGLNLLRKLLFFEQDGNFPVYQHEFPVCRDRMLGIKLLPVFHFVLFDFHAILESTLYDQLEKLIKRILNAAQALSSQEILPARYAQFIAAYEQSEYFSWALSGTPEQMAEALILMHMAKRGAPFTIKIENWHAELATYTGPQEQEKNLPKVTLFDLFMSSLLPNCPARFIADHATHLRAALVYPLESACILPQKIPLQKISSHSRQPYTLYWGSCDELHSLVCDPQKTTVHIEPRENGAIFSFAAKTPVSEDGPIEMAFLWNIHPDHAFFVNGKKATAFQCGDAVEIHSAGLRFQIIFSLEQGNGVFYGHFSRANRPLQCAAKGPLRYEAFDWQLGLRTIKRSEHCTVRATLTWV